MSTVLLGYELLTGRSVEIPIGHMVIVGQSQRAGKTTALEACAFRCGYRSIAFLTKRGEESFRVANKIEPYYEDSIDWRTVRSLCEALTEERWDKFQRQCLRSVCRAGQSGRGKNLAEWPRPDDLNGVLKNIEIVLAKSTGQREMVFGEIHEDLRTVNEELARLRSRSQEIKLQRGLNVINLEAYEFHIKSLIIRSVIRWVHKKAQKTIVAIPEAWQYAPAQRRSPVRDAAEEFIRQGANLENFLWVDSQNIAGVSAVLLGQCRVWLFGIQRLRSEIEKTLDAIPDNIDPRPKASEIATLGKGQFIVCFDREMYRCYVQPAWMRGSHAQAIAMGEEPVESAQQIARDYDFEHATEEP